MSCPLCRPIQKKTKWYYEDEDFTILDCRTCGTPMLVVREHTMKPSQEVIDKMIDKAKELFGENIGIRKTQRQIKDHLHYHVEEVDNHQFKWVVSLGGIV